MTIMPRVRGKLVKAPGATRPACRTPGSCGRLRKRGFWECWLGEEAYNGSEASNHNDNMIINLIVFHAVLKECGLGFGV